MAAGGFCGRFFFGMSPDSRVGGWLDHCNNASNGGRTFLDLAVHRRRKRKEKAIRPSQEGRTKGEGGEGGQLRPRGRGGEERGEL